MISTSTIIGIVVTGIVSYLGGDAAGGVLAKLNLFGFGRKITIARHVYKYGKALRAAYLKNQSESRKAELKKWLKEHDANNENGIGDGVV